MRVFLHELLERWLPVGRAQTLRQYRIPFRCMADIIDIAIDSAAAAERKIEEDSDAVEAVLQLITLAGKLLNSSGYVVRHNPGRAVQLIKHTAVDDNAAVGGDRPRLLCIVLSIPPAVLAWAGVRRRDGTACAAWCWQ